MKKKNEKKQIEQSENSMGTVGIPGLVLETGVPLMISLLINSLYNFVDSNICLTCPAAFQGLGVGVQSMSLTLGRQVVLPVIFIAVLSRIGNLPLIWMAFVLAEAVVIPSGMILWRKESGKVLKPLE